MNVSTLCRPISGARFIISLKFHLLNLNTVEYIECVRMIFTYLPFLTIQQGTTSTYIIYADAPLGSGSGVGGHFSARTLFSLMLVKFIEVQGSRRAEMRDLPPR